MISKKESSKDCRECTGPVDLFLGRPVVASVSLGPTGCKD